VFFVKYSDTEWRMARGRKALPCETYEIDLMRTNGYIYAGDILGGSYKLAFCVMIVGICTAEEQWPPANDEVTRFLDPAGTGYTFGDKVLLN
jgi:hypothetical protein